MKVNVCSWKEVEPNHYASDVNINFCTLAKMLLLLKLKHFKTTNFYYYEL